MDRIKKAIKEVLSTPPKKEKCNCGCHSCENVGNEGPVLNTKIKNTVVTTENMKYHIDNKLPLTKTKLKYGSESFLDLWAEARYLYSRNIIHVNDLDKKVITQTNLGEYGLIGDKKVPLDLLEEESDLGTKLDVDIAGGSFMVPYDDLINTVVQDFSKDSDLYHDLMTAIFDKDSDKIIEILKYYKVYNDYLHLLNVNKETETGDKHDVDYAKLISFKALSDVPKLSLDKFYDTKDIKYLKLTDELERLFSQNEKNKINYHEIVTVLKKHLGDEEANNMLAALNVGINESMYVRTKRRIILLENSAEKLYQIDGILVVNSNIKTQSQVFSDVRSITGITTMNTEDYTPRVPKPGYEYNKVTLKIDPYPYLVNGNFDEETLKQIIQNISNIRGVVRFNAEPILNNVGI